MELRLVPPEDPGFAALTQKLDEYYISLVGDVHLRYAKFNDPKNFACRAVVYDDAGTPAACGCWKAVDRTTGEIKRIYVLPQYRRRGLASQIVKAMEEDLARSGRTRAVLETARTTPDSEKLYLSLGYHVIDYYGSPAGAENCLCFEKLL